MPFGAVTLKPGVDTESTATLSRASYSTSNLLRFRAGLAEKIGGWLKYFQFALGGVPRAMQAWQDFNDNQYLAVGTTTVLDIISDDQLTVITPQAYTSDFTPNFSTTLGSAVVTVTDYNIANVTTFDTVEFNTPISVDRIILSGSYPIDTILSSTSYQITAASTGFAGVTSGGAVPVFTTTSGSALVSVAFNRHGLSVGGTIVFPIPTEVGGVTIEGTYSALSITSVDIFVISASTQATSTATLPMNYNGNDTYTKVLLHMNGTDTSTTFTDTNAGGSAHTWTATGTAQIDVAQYKFGGASMLMDGVGDYISTPDHADFTLGSGDFTIDFWFNCAVTAGTFGRMAGQIDAAETAAGSAWNLLKLDTDFIRFSAFVGGSTIAVTSTSTYTSATNTGWHHLAIVRTGTTLKMFIDGAQQGGNVTLSGTVNNCADPLLIGSYGSFHATDFKSWYDEFRLSVGIARWTTTFTPATVSYGGNAEIVYFIGLGPVSSAGTSYSFGDYSSGPYSGTGAAGGSPQTGTPIAADDWTLDNWGQTLLACPADGGVYKWTPNTGFQTATLATGAPLHNGGLFVATPYQILIVWGTTVEKDIGIDQDPLTWRGSDILDYEYWEIGTTNPATGDASQAYTNRIPTGSAIKAGMATPQQILLWTDLDLWSLNYLGPPLIWGQTKIGSNCGAVSRHGMAQMGGVVYWWSRNNFYALAGGAPQIIPCSVWDIVFQNLDTDNRDKCWIETVTSFNECWFFYPSETGGTGQCDSYAKVNVTDGSWDYGTLPRSIGIDQSVLGQPIMASPTGVLYSHEVGYNADGQPLASSYLSGYFYLSEGQEYITCDKVYPDFKLQTADGSSVDAIVTITFYVIDNVGDTPRTYTINASTTSTEIDVRFRGRQIAIGMECSGIDMWFRVGKMRFRYSVTGRR